MSNSSYTSQELLIHTVSCNRVGQKPLNSKDGARESYLKFASFDLMWSFYMYKRI